MTTDQMREYQAKRRGGRSYVSEIKALQEQVRRLEICMAWEAGEIGESTAMKLMGIDRLSAREVRLTAIARGLGYETLDEWNEVRMKKPTEG